MEQEVRIIQVQGKKGGVFRVSVPKREVVEALGLVPHQQVRVIIDKEKRRFIYEIIE